MNRTVLVHKPGPIENHTVEEVPELAPSDREVVVDLYTSVVNYPDLLVMTGRYQSTPPLPFTPGKEGSGIVRKVGAGVRKVKPGDRVLIHIEYGTFATQAIANEAQCFQLPDEMSFEESAAIGLAAQTAWFALYQRGEFTKGNTVLISGATGAVGSAAVQIVAAHGGTALAAISNRVRCEMVLGDTPHTVIDLSMPDLRNNLREKVYAATNNRGADLVIDALGGDFFDAALRATAWCGRAVVLGFASGRIPEIKANYLLVKNISVSGLQWSDYRDRSPHLVERAHKGLVELWRKGSLKSPIKVIEMDNFKQALEDIETRNATGRIVLRLRQEA